MWEDLLLFVAVGFAAQMVDGAIGMAYGVISTSVMLSLGIPPATTSACVHAAETFTTAVSGASHWQFGNVDRKLLLRLALPGAIGGAIGAYVLTNLPGDKIKPFISAYLLLIGLFYRLEGAQQARLGRHGAFARRAARLHRRPPRFHRRRRLGSDRHLDAHRPGHDAALRHRLGQSRRVLRHPDHLGDLRRHHRPRAVADHHRPHHRRRHRRAVRGLRDENAARQGADDPRRLRRGHPEPAHHRHRPHLTPSALGAGARFCG